MTQDGKLPVAVILLATYNGEKFLRQQLDSIFQQVGVIPIVFCRDDGSTDGTLCILREYERSHSLQVVSDHLTGGSAAKNFRHLVMQIDHTAAQYFFFCDQDDVWLEDKMLTAIQKLREGYCLYSSALTPFYLDGRKGKVLKSVVTTTSFDHLFQGLSAGCTYAITQDFFLSIQGVFVDPWFDREGFSHDWLIYTLARTSDRKIFHDPESHILYRQHTANVQGAAMGLRGAIYRLKSLRDDWYVAQILKNIEYCRERPNELDILLAFRQNNLLFLMRHLRQLRRSMLEGVVVVLLSAIKRKVIK